MSRAAEDVEAFYRERIPTQWNHTLDRQGEAATDDPGARNLFEQMQRVDGTIDVVVRSEGTDRTYHLNIESGRMSSDERGTHDPFIALIHDLDTFETLERESGDSVLGFLGALAGQSADMKLTAARLRNLRMLNGSARIEITGGAPMDLIVRFGGPATDTGPDCTLRIGSDAFTALRSGDLAPQDAFMAGQVEIDGDMQLAMQLALAALSPE
jgi:hypothetical protein